MKDKSLVLQAKADDVEITKDGNNVSIHFKNNLAIKVVMENGGMIHSKDDFFIVSEGELGLMSVNKPLTLDSINSELHMNYRQSKIIKDLPESIEYRKRLDSRDEECIQIESKMPEKTLEERVTELENFIKNLKQIKCLNKKEVK